MTRSEWMSNVFEKCGPDVDAGLRMLGDTDPDGDMIGDYLAAAAARCYKTDYEAWRRRQVRSVQRETRQTARLFDVGDAEAKRLIRQRVVFDGQEYEQAALAGPYGAEILRSVATRDLKPAKTTVDRCKFQLQLADVIEKESARLERDVSVAEILGLEAAA